MIPAAAVAFAIALPRIGLAPALLVLTFIGSRAGHGTLWQAATTSAVLTAAAVMVFVWGLGLPLPVWPE
jgi:hypothetical protein